MSQMLTVAAYLACVAVAGLLAIRSHSANGRFATLREVLDTVLADRATRVTLILFWWWLGWHFLAGQTVDPPVPG